MKRPLAFALVFAAVPAAAMPLDQDEIAFAAALQKAVRADDRQWLAAHLADPFRYCSQESCEFQTAPWFVQHYAEAMNPRLKAAILADPAPMHGKTISGTMIGSQKQFLTGADGAPFDTGGYNVWFAYVSRDGNLTHFRIVTISDRDLGRTGR